MRSSASWLVLLAPVAFAGCTVCTGAELFEQVKQGQVRAIHEVGELGDPVVPPPRTVDLKRIDQAFEALEPHLKSIDRFKRLMAVEATRRLAQRARSLYRDRYPSLLDATLSDADPELRWRAAWTLGRLGLTRPALHKAARDPHERVAERAVWALGEAKDENAIPELLAALDRKGRVSTSAVASLQKITGKELPDAKAWRAWGKARQKPGKK